MLLTDFILPLKRLPSCSILLYIIKGIHQSQGILDSPWWHNSCRSYQELVQGNLYSFDQEKVFLLSSYLLPIHIINLTTRKIMLASLIHSIPHTLLKKHFPLEHLSQSGYLQASKTSGFFFLLMFLVSSAPSTITLRFHTLYQ